MNEILFNVVYLEDAINFISSLPEKVRKKIQYNIGKSQSEYDKELFAKLKGSDDIWEFRTKYNGMAYRLLAFWDTESKSLVIATHGFMKKSQKTPISEIKRAEQIKKEYYNSKCK